MFNLLSFYALIDLLLIIRLSINLVSCDVIWIGNSGTSCDFVNNDLSNTRTSSADCFEKCNETVGCTHFTWTLYNGGTCWMKKGTVYKDDAFATTASNIICGMMKDENYSQLVVNTTIIITPFISTIVRGQGQLISRPYLILFLSFFLRI